MGAKDEHEISINPGQILSSVKIGNNVLTAKVKEQNKFIIYIWKDEGFAVGMTNYFFDLDISITFDSAQMSSLGVLVAANKNNMYFFTNIKDKVYS